jgi:hypothetical protein
MLCSLLLRDSCYALPEPLPSLKILCIFFVSAADLGRVQLDLLS